MRTVTGLFDDYTDARTAVSELEAAGVPSRDISIVSNNAGGHYAEDTNAAKGTGAGAGIGAVIGGAGGLLTGLGVMAIPGVGPVVAAGWLAATAVGAAGGAVAVGAVRGLIGAMTRAGISKDDANVYAEGVRRGGSFVTARVEEAFVPEAEAILKRARRVDPAERRLAYHEQGWTGFDEMQRPFSPEDVKRERSRYRHSAV
ncbi:hypothetical protein G6L68_23115 [Agrobacterium fabrum]|uniref:general stress protein n=1 Tax=Agrobacterium fabrum TaxID=1176649 RepID=UPI000EF58856|nr:general stress protein [Agrobacterium fabrum]AYM66006.1 hypothetical protein At12D13_48540 [Agrobacterium fabrum]NTE63543.1 hypothetical protein [Agrobacterium fabrum]